MGRLIDEDSLKFTNFEIVMCEGDFKKAFKLLCEKLDNAPTVDSEPIRHGRWIQYLKEGLKWKCSECGSRYNAPYHYCPNCGAKMGEVM